MDAHVLQTLIVMIGILLVTGFIGGLVMIDQYMRRSGDYELKRVKKGIEAKKLEAAAREQITKEPAR
jgi:hypothetical protein